VVARGEIWLTALDPAIGSEIQKTRPCVVVAPMTTGSKPARYRVPLVFDGRRGLILLDQLRTLDQVRLVKRLGRVAPKAIGAMLAALQELFAP
jgi:mRNA interferase MazF